MHFLHFYFYMAENRAMEVLIFFFWSNYLWLRKYYLDSTPKMKWSDFYYCYPGVYHIHLHLHHFKFSFSYYQIHWYFLTLNISSSFWMKYLYLQLILLIKCLVRLYFYIPTRFIKYLQLNIEKYLDNLIKCWWSVFYHYQRYFCYYCPNGFHIFKEGLFLYLILLGSIYIFLFMEFRLSSCDWIAWGIF